MLPQLAIPVLCILWVLVCVRFYLIISRENIWQRRIIAIAAGLGAGLIYLLGSTLVPFLQTPSEHTEPKIESFEDVRIKGQ